MKRTPPPLLLVVLLSGATALLAARYGSVTVAWSELFSSPLSPLRWSRTAAAIVLGGGLALAGMVCQAIFRNPLADPYTLGVSGGAGVGAAACFIVGGSAALQWLFSVPLAALAGGLIALGIVLAAANCGRASAEKLLLCGVITGTVTASILSALISRADNDELAGLTWWLLGDLQGIAPAALAILTGVVLVSFGVIRFYANDLNALSLGEETALQLGVAGARTRFILVLAASAITSTAVAAAGIIGFVGLIVPHLVRRLLGCDARRITGFTFWAGALFLQLCDLAARLIDPVKEVPVGVLTACCGGLLFLTLLHRRKGAFL